MTDLKLTDQLPRHKNDGHENGGQIYKLAGHKVA